MKQISTLLFYCLLALGVNNIASAQEDGFTGLKADAVTAVDGMEKLTQEIVDSLFSFSELGFQEFETQRYLSEILVDKVSR